MVRSRSFLAVVVSLAIAASFVAVAQAQQRGRGGMSRASLVGLLRREQVQTEMKLTEAQKTQVQAIVEKLNEEARDQYAALREIEDRAQRTAKRNELSRQIDAELREQLRGMELPREQMIRLYQIRLQVRPVVDSLASERLASRLNITDEQKKRLAETNQELQAKQTELYGASSNASQEQRGSMYQRLRQLRTEADENALAVLTAEQKTAFEEMKGKIIELQSQRGQRGTN